MKSNIQIFFVEHLTFTPQNSSEREGINKNIHVDVHIRYCCGWYDSMGGARHGVRSSNVQRTV